jgi:hypothetical protein
MKVELALKKSLLLERGALKEQAYLCIGPP